MKLHKKGSSALGGTAMKVVYGFLGIVLLLLLSAELLPEVMTAVTNVGSIPDLPLAGLFTGGVIVMIIVVVIIVAVFKQAGTVAK
ncbi:hypothetical protein EOM09_02610 [bacterium]|nr:hypothetical protein [bacterium]